ncbi:hypothetical protein VPH35_023472 [Triticum aestivum]
MGAAELTISELQKLIQATVIQSKAVSDARVRNSERIDELRTTVDSFSESTTKALSDLTGSTATATQRVETTLDRIITAHNKLDKTADELKLSMEAVARRVDFIERGQPPSMTPAQPHQRPGVLRPHGHREELHHQGAVSGEIRTSGHALVGGEQSQTRDHLTSAMYGSAERDDDRTTAYPHQPYSHSGPRLPKSDFPKFTGDNPKWWKEQCEKYFKMYHVNPELWVDFATMHFTGNAALWLQTFEAMHSVDSWPALCVGVFAKFNKNQYAKLMDMFFAFRQVASVDEYAHTFEEFMHKILVYNHSYDETFFVNRFIDGLKPDIKSAIKLHNPGTVDLACSLAQTQEVLLVEDTRPSFKKGDYRHKFKMNAQLPSILGNPGEKRTDDRIKYNTKFDSLKAQRRARGECFKCGEKFSPGHKCPPQVQLHVLEELITSLDISDDKDDNGWPEEHTPDPDEDDHVMKLSVHAACGAQCKKSIQLQGFIGKQEVLILVDSGSSSNFISSKLVDRLQCTTAPFPAAKVTVADGGTLDCNMMVSSLQWWTQGTSFTSSLKVLPLGTYDIILGMEWLEEMSPMWVDWKKKTSWFTHNGVRITLRGIKDKPASCSAISAKQLQGLVNNGGVVHMLELCAVQDVFEAPGSSTPLPPAITRVLSQHEAVFEDPQVLPPHRSFDHNIPLLPGVKPVNVKPYRYAPMQKTEIERQVREMLQKGLIQNSTSSFASPVLLVKKKDGSWRFCVDYRHLNNITVKNKYPMPVIDELLDELSGANWFTKLDLKSGYHQIRLVRGEEHKSAFKTHQGLYEFKHQLYIKKSKCSFAQKQLEYLGHIISHKGVATDPSKIQVVAQWPTPTTVKQVRGFLGLTGYYRKFIKHYGIISRVLSDLLRKDTMFYWTNKEDEAFQHLKSALTQAPVLALPNFKLPFVVETDASKYGIGVVLMQQGHPISFLRKALGPKTQGYSTYEKECLAILMAVEKWRSYLQHAEFTISTDHRSLTYLSEQKLTTNIQQKAFLKLMGLQYKLVYKKGHENAAADALSRQAIPESCHAISLCQPKWLEVIVDGYTKDDTTKKLLQELSFTGSNSAGYTLVNGIIRHKGRVWLGSNTKAHQAILLSLHASGIGGHSGFLATYKRISALFAWPGMKTDVKTYVQNCTICQQAKSETVKLPGLLNPLPIPDEPWSLVSMDFVEGLPKSGSYNTILVVIDKYTKFGHFIPLAHPYSALQVAQLFYNHIYKLHGLPSGIISDRDKVFTSNVWQSLFKMTDVKMNMSSAHHPQTDGQTEKLNQCLETFLRCTVRASPTKWS